jgi:chromosome segregation ATPase
MAEHEQVVKLQRETQELAKSLADAKERADGEVLSMRTSMSDALRERDQVRAQRDRQREELQQLHFKTLEMEELIMVSEVVSKELVNAKSKATSASSRAEAMSQALKNLEVARNQAAQDAASAREREAELQQQLSKAQRSAAAMPGLEGELREAKERAGHFLEELRGVEKGSDHMKNVISTMRKDMALQQQRCADMEEDMSKLRARCEELELQLGRARDERVVAKEELLSVENNLIKLSSERDQLAGEKNELQIMVAKLSGKLEELVEEALKRQQMDAHNSTVLARLQETNNKYKKELEALEKELATIEEEKLLILSNMAETLAAGSDAEMAVRNLSDRLSQRTSELHVAKNTLELQEEELKRLREYSGDRDSIDHRLKDAEQRLLIAMAAVKGKDEALMEKEKEIALKDERIKRLVDNDWQNPGTSGGGAVGGGRGGTSDSELQDARATIAALQGQVDTLSELWAAAKADADEANGGRDGKANGVQNGAEEKGDEKKVSWVGGWLGGGGAGKVEESPTPLQRTPPHKPKSQMSPANAETPPRPAADSEMPAEMRKQMDALEKHVDVLERDLRSSRDALEVCVRVCLCLYVCACVHVHAFSMTCATCTSAYYVVS